MVFGKKGAAHLEMILAFILFMTFVVFLFVYIQPYKSKGIGDSVLLNLQDGFEKNAETELSIVFLKVDSDDNSEDCFKIPFEGIAESGGSRVFKRTGGGVDGVSSSFSLQKLHVNLKSGFFYVYISDEFEDEGFSCSNNLTKFEIGSILKKKVLSEKKLGEIKNKYERYVPEKVNVFSISYIEDVLSSDGKIKSREFILKTW